MRKFFATYTRTHMRTRLHTYTRTHMPNKQLHRPQLPLVNMAMCSFLVCPAYACCSRTSLLSTRSPMLARLALQSSFP